MSRQGRSGKRRDNNDDGLQNNKNGNQLDSIAASSTWSKTRAGVRRATIARQSTTKAGKSQDRLGQGGAKKLREHAGSNESRNVEVLAVSKPKSKSSQRTRHSGGLRRGRDHVQPAWGPTEAVGKVNVEKIKAQESQGFSPTVTGSGSRELEAGTESQSVMNKAGLNIRRPRQQAGTPTKHSLAHSSRSETVPARIPPKISVKS